jgi:hypothetical protein
METLFKEFLRLRAVLALSVGDFGGANSCCHLMVIIGKGKSLVASPLVTLKVRWYTASTLPSLEDGSRLGRM